VGRKSKSQALEAEIERLPDLGLAELRTRWQDLYGRPAPKFFRRKLLVRAVAYQMQVKACGGLSEATKRRLREIAAAARDGTFDPVMAEPRIKPGTKLIRTWKKATHEVMVLDDGFAWNGQRYSSLSTIAKTITGTSWNGWRFFGLNRPTARSDRDVRGMFKRPKPGPNGQIIWPRARQAAKRRFAHSDAANA
jgi:plastocyanin